MDVYQINILKQFPQIKHAISTKSFESMKKDDGSLHFANLMKFAKTQKFSAMPISMNQVHGTTVAMIENDRELVLPATDSMITNKKNLPLTIVTADCLPILFYDPKNKAIGVAHAGRKGLAAGIIAEIIAVMQSAYDSDPKDIIVGIGPSIEKDCYEVDEKIVKGFEEAFPEFDGVFEKKAKKYFLDLRATAQQSLQKEGILEEHIEISEVCTKCDARFYSYRRGDKMGRFATIISLV